MSLTPPDRGRVVESRHIARTAFLAALAFALVAVGWSIYVLAAGGSWWGPLHAFLAGTILLDISGASQMFTITWSSTTPPPRAWVLTQRWLIIVGVAAVLVAVTFDMSSLVWLGGASAVAGFALLGEIIYAAIHKSLLRRFDVYARFYLAAFAAGVIGSVSARSWEPDRSSPLRHLAGLCTPTSTWWGWSVLPYSSHNWRTCLRFSVETGWPPPELLVTVTMTMGMRPTPTSA